MTNTHPSWAAAASLEAAKTKHEHIIQQVMREAKVAREKNEERISVMKEQHKQEVAALERDVDLLDSQVFRMQASSRKMPAKCTFKMVNPLAMAWPTAQVSAGVFSKAWHTEPLKDSKCL